MNCPVEECKVESPHYHKGGITIWGNRPYEQSTLERVQHESGEWRAKAYPDTATGPLQALGMAEEVGEVCHAVLKHVQQIRGYTDEKTRAEVADGVGDVIIYACGVADAYGIDIDAALMDAWAHVRDRNITQGSMGDGNPTPEMDDEGFNAAGEWVGDTGA